MTRLFQQGPIWRRALWVTVTMIGVSTVFVATMLLLLGSLADLAVAPASDGTTDATSVPEVSAQPLAPSRAPAKGVKTPKEQS
ncbi:MAG TPA: hypothetical protein PKL73_21900 [Polyangiaceae bacterium]|nr:MAG: hypothetical protein BWY17_02974 [Deltaproteobacteria bacterium ADurb.Bin207]HNS99628.1 hypothetical protein [Polyangiaceae bacterium]HNZ21990.1 hypothetical protein [Polyangiaceae bacterium]HOD23174.1 hypothetical protein [Polyangiaceae bacterium]HOE47298.1 hypothetical protein [Polyangiaceae bacterium]